MFYDMVKESGEYIRQRTPQLPSIGVILGSGLGGQLPGDESSWN